MMEGILIVDKPQDITSHDVVKHIRKLFFMKRVGHAGTLDPMATGILVILLGKATQLFSRFSNFDKEYVATLTLGLETETGDLRGKIKKEFAFEKIDENRIEEVLKQFIGEIEQIPPMFSALKFKGQKLYQLARKGIEVERKPRPIVIYSIKLLKFEPPNLDFCVRCSKGAYIRTLAEDIAKALGTRGCLSALRRTELGQFKIKEAVKLEEINESHIRSWPG